jgi:phytoene synthase
MQDAFAYCAGLVREADRDRFIASLFAPAERRGALHALYAFNTEIMRVREAAHTALPGEIRLQWWSEVIGRQRDGEAEANPVASALLATIDRHHLPSEPLADLIEAHRFDLYDEPMASLAELDAYVRRTSSALFALAVRVLSGADVPAVTEPAGVGYGIVGLLRAFPQHASRGQLYVPADILERHQVGAHDVFAGRPSPALDVALGELRDLARERLTETKKQIAMLPEQAASALLPAALVRPWLDRLDRGGAFSPPELPAWRRQWLIWRAARHPARIAD